MATRLPLDERIELAGQLVGRARIFYDIWRFYEGAETRPAILGTMNQYPDYFRFDTHAHFVTFTVYMASLVEARSDTVNLSALVEECESSHAVAVRTIANAKAIVAQIDPLRPKVIILRSNLFAHRSASLSYEEGFRLAQVTPNQLRDLTQFALQLVNTLLVGRGLQEQAFHEPSLVDAKAILHTLATAHAT
jgi:hypothetical protein